MGTGKTSLGTELARRLNWPFVDMDHLIEARRGQTIRQIFTREGEAAFRQLETDLCCQIAGWRGYVIATGGGTLLNPANRAALSAGNLLVCLDCEPETLWQRLAQAADRPMLDSPDKKARLLALLERRRPAYAAIEHHLDTTRRPIARLVADLLALYRQTVAV